MSYQIEWSVEINSAKKRLLEASCGLRGLNDSEQMGKCSGLLHLLALRSLACLYSTDCISIQARTSTASGGVSKVGG